MRQANKTLTSKDAAGNVNGKIDSFVLHKGPGILLSLFGYNAGGAQFIHLHDAAAQPVDGTVPLHTFAIAAADNFSSIVPLTGVNFSAGLVACVSTTANTTTLGAKDATVLATLVA